MNNKSKPLLDSYNPHVEINRSKSGIIFEICVGLLSYFTFAVFFGLFVNNEKYYGPECVDSPLLLWSNRAFYNFLVSSILTTIISPFFIWLSNRTNSQIKKSLYDKILNFIRAIVCIFALIFWIALWIAYMESEHHCNYLGSLVYAYLWIFTCVMIVVFLILFCFALGYCCLFRKERNSRKTTEFQRF